MSEIKPLLRDFRESDYESCEQLVNIAWKIDINFKPKKLSSVVKCLYTKGSIRASNFRKVVVMNGTVVGFIFGLNEMSSKPKNSILFGLNIMRRILFITGVSFKDKKQLIKNLNTHEINRSKIVDKAVSEILLFVVRPDYQGVGNGKKLLSEFITQCKKLKVRSIIVETNKLGASSFYQGVGFKHIGDFHSPLHEYAMKNGQACMYEYTCK